MFRIRMFTSTTYTPDVPRSHEQRPVRNACDAQPLQTFELCFVQGSILHNNVGHSPGQLERRKEECSSLNIVP